MNRMLAAVLCLAAVFGASARGLVAEEAARVPRISISPERFDFGSVLPEKELTREFVVRNVGSADLVIEKVAPSCGCTIVKKYDSLVKPGTSTVLHVVLTTPRAAGKLQKSVLVRSNDPARATVELKLEATVGAAAQ
jgi:hypothetical protein